MNVLEWPSQSPDPSPTKKVWSEVKRAKWDQSDPVSPSLSGEVGHNSGNCYEILMEENPEWSIMQFKGTYSMGKKK